MTFMRLFPILLLASGCLTGCGCNSGKAKSPESDPRKDAENKCPDIPDSPPYAKLTVDGLDLNKPAEFQELKDKTGRVIGRLGVDLSRRKDGLVRVRYDFGAMDYGSSRTHVFKITNRGEGPLEVVKSSSTCQCTVAGVGSSGLKKGESTEVKLTWEAKGPSEQFEQTAELCTNDPTCKTIAFTVTGTVARSVEIIGGNNWEFSRIEDDAQAKLERDIISRVHANIEITGVEYPEKLLDIKTKKLTNKQLLEIDQYGVRPLSGYKVTVKLKHSDELGRFRHDVKFKIKTGENEKASTFPVAVSGSRSGPIIIRRGSGGNSRYYSSIMHFDLGDISTKKATESSLVLYVGGLKDVPLKIESFTCDPDFIQVKLEPVANKAKATTTIAGGKLRARQQYRLTFIIPPYQRGRPRNAYTALNPAKVVVRTNHPKAESITFGLRFNPRIEP